MTHYYRVEPVKNSKAMLAEIALDKALQNLLLLDPNSSIKAALFFRSFSQEASLKFSKSQRQVVGSLVGKQEFLNVFFR